MTAASTIDSLWRTEAPKLIAALTRLVRDVAVAEELAQDALVAALEHWPIDGLPENPGAWLTTTAKRRALNGLRDRSFRRRTLDAFEHRQDEPQSLAEVEAALEAGMDCDVGDDVLRLIFAACHPLLSQEARVALTLRLVGGLSTVEIARAFLTSEPTIAQRLVRAKRALGDTGVPFEVPGAASLSERLASVLEVVYLIFNEGYSASAGDDLLRPALSEEALRLGSLLAALAPAEPEILGLLALMLLQSSRATARVDAEGEPVLLSEQDRSRWDATKIQAGLAALERAEGMGRPPGTYQIQAAIAACHARANSASATDWGLIARLYLRLGTLQPSPVIELNRAMAVSRAEGPAAGLVLLEALAKEPALQRYHWLPSARADLLEQLGRYAEARIEFLRAAGLTENRRQNERLLARAKAAGERGS